MSEAFWGRPCLRASRPWEVRLTTQCTLATCLFFEEYSGPAGPSCLSWGHVEPAHSSLAKPIALPWVVCKNTQVQVQLWQAREVLGVQPEVKTRDGRQLRLLPCNHHGCFLVMQRIKNFLSHLARSTCFPIFHLEVCTPSAVGHPSGSTAGFLETFKEMCSYSQEFGLFVRYLQRTPSDWPSAKHTWHTNITPSEPKAHCLPTYVLSLRWDHMAHILPPARASSPATAALTDSCWEAG